MEEEFLESVVHYLNVSCATMQESSSCHTFIIYDMSMGSIWDFSNVDNIIFHKKMFVLFGIKFGIITPPIGNEIIIANHSMLVTLHSVHELNNCEHFSSPLGTIW